MGRKGFPEQNYVPGRDAKPKTYKGSPTDKVTISERKHRMGTRIAILAARGYYERCHDIIDQERAHDIKRKKKKKPTREQALNLSIHAIGLGEKNAQMLDGIGILTVRALYACPEKELMEIENWGPKAMEDVKDKLGRLGL